MEDEHEEESELNKVSAALFNSHNKFTSVLSSGIDLETRSIYLMGEIDEKIAYHFMAALAHFDATEGDIRLVISSPGGTEYCGYAMYDALRRTQNTVIAEGYGMVGSIASAVMQGADIRYLAENCEYLIHNGYLEMDEANMEQDRVLQLADQIKNNNRKYYQILSENSKLSLETVKKYCEEEKTFTAQEAVLAGLADELLRPLKSKVRKRKRKGK